MSDKKYSSLFSALETALEKHAQEIADFIDGSVDSYSKGEHNPEKISEGMVIETLIEEMKEALVSGHAILLNSLVSTLEYYEKDIAFSQKTKLEKIAESIDSQVIRAAKNGESKNTLEFAKSKSKLYFIISRL